MPQFITRLRLIEARPYDTTRLPRRADCRQIQQAFQRHHLPIQIDVRGPADFQAFADAVEQGVEIIHFDGHAEHKEGDGSYLLFEGRRSGTRDLIPLATVLEHIDRHRREQPVLLCLSSCNGLAEVDRAQAQSCEGLAALVAFDSTVRSDDSSEFFRIFYDQLAQGRSIGDGFNRACAELQRHTAANDRLQTSRKSAAQPVLSSTDPNWALFEREVVSTGTVELLADPISLSGIVEIDDCFQSLRDNAAALHRYLLNTGRSKRCIAIVGPRDTGRSSLVRNVALHVAWDYRAVIHLEVDPRVAPSGADALASGLLQSLPADAQRARRDEGAVKQLKNELESPSQGVLVIVEVAKIEHLTSEAWQLLAGAQAPSSVLVIGEGSLRALGWQTLAIQPVSRLDAKRFFCKHLPVDARGTAILMAIDRYFAQIYAHVGGHPLALRSAATTIQTASDVRRLAHTVLAPHPEPWLELTLNTIRTQDNIVESLRVLALFIGSIPQRQAMRIVDHDTPHELDDLVERGLLFRSGAGTFSSLHEGEVYSLHALVRRALLRERELDPLVAFEAFRRSSVREFDDHGWHGCWRRSLLTWARTLRGPDIAAFRNEQLLDALVATVTGASHRERQELERRWRHERAADALEQLSNFLRLCDRDKSAALCQMYGVRNLLRSGNLVRAERAAQSLARQNENSLQQATGLGLLADIRRRQGAIPDARQLYERALRTASWSDAPTVVAQALRGLAEIEREDGSFSAAIGRLDTAANMLGEPKYAQALSSVLERQAYVHQVLRHHGCAVALYERATSVLSDRSPERVRPLIGMADVYANHGHFKPAEAFFTRAIKLARTVENRLLEAEAWARRARARVREDHRMGVIDAIINAERLLEGGEVPVGYRRLQLVIELAEAAAQVNETQRARDMLDQAAGHGFRDIAGPAGHATVLRAQALILEQQAMQLPSGSERLDAFVNTGAMFEQAAASFGEIHHAWRAARCRLHRLRCLRQAGDEDRDQAFYRQAYKLADWLHAEFMRMGDRLRRAYALQQAGLLSELFGEGEQAARQFEAARMLQEQLDAKADSGQVALPSATPAHDVLFP